MWQLGSSRCKNKSKKFDPNVPAFDVISIDKGYKPLIHPKGMEGTYGPPTLHFGADLLIGKRLVRDNIILDDNVGISQFILPGRNTCGCLTVPLSSLFEPALSSFHAPLKA